MAIQGRRIKEGKISIIKHRCEHCGHHKAINKNKGIECSKCKRITK